MGACALAVVLGPHAHGGLESSGRGERLVGPDQSQSAIAGIVIDARTRRPLDDARVSVQGPPGKGTVGTAALTDSDGRFLIDDLAAPGTHALVAARAGYFSTAQEPKVVVLRASQAVVKNVVIELWPHAVVQGIVRDVDGRPIGDSRVFLSPMVWVSGRPHFIKGAETSTDADGRYEFRRVQQGRYAVAVRPRAFKPGERTGAGRPTGHEGAVYPGGGALNESALVSIGSGEVVAGVDFALAPVPLFRVRGVVKSESPLPDGVQVSLLPSALEKLGQPAAFSRVRLKGGSGEFEFQRVPSGTYVARVDGGLASLVVGGSGSVPIALDAQGIVFQVGSASAMIAEGPSSIAGRTPVDYRGETLVIIEDRDIDGVAIDVNLRATVHGHVVFEPPDEARELMLVAYPATGDLSQNVGVGWARPETGGRFVITGLDEGPYVVQPAPDSTAIVRSVAADGQEQSEPLQATHGASIGPVTITVTNRAAQVVGTVQRRTRAPSDHEASLSVAMFPADPSLWRDYGVMSPRLRAEPVDPGTSSFKALGVPAGEYFIVAIDRALGHLWKNPESMQEFASRAVRFRVGWGEVREIVVPESR